MGWEFLRGIVKEEEREGLWTKLEGQDRVSHCQRESAGLSWHPLQPAPGLLGHLAALTVCPMGGGHGDLCVAGGAAMYTLLEIGAFLLGIQI